MRILIITPHFPWIGCGGGLRLFNTIKSYSKRHKVTLLTILKPEQAHLVKELSNYCDDIITVRREGLDAHGQSSIIGKFFRKLSNLYRLLTDSIKERGLSLPSDVLRYNCFDHFRKKVNEVLKSSKFDVVEINFPEIGFLGRHLPGDVIKIYSSHEVRTVNRLRIYKLEKNIVKRFKSYVEWRRTEQYENTLAGLYDFVVAYSPKDRDFFARSIPHNTQVLLVPTGVNLEQYVYEDCAERDQNTLVFLGYYNNRPNEDAVIYFAEEILPLIKKKIPTVKFYIVGSNPTQKIMDLADHHNIFVTGFVDDLRTYLHKSTAFVVPIRMGGGIKGKIVEAMACGIPVVSTPEGCEGIEVTPGENIIVSHSTKDFIQKTVHLLEDKNLQQRMSLAGRKLVEEKYNWIQNFRTLEKGYESALQDNAEIMCMKVV